MSEKYEFIDGEYAAHAAANAAGAPTILQMCTRLSVSKSGYYERRSRPTSATAQRRELLQQKIGELFDDSDGTYGYRRIHAALARAGERVSPELVRKLMRRLGLVPCQPRPYRTTTVRGEAAGAGDLVDRDISAETPGTKLVSDITYIWTWEGWLYLATILDCFNREVIGYAMADHMRTALVTEALDMLAKDRIVHSDHGTQYTSAEFATKLAELELRQSLGRTGICLDNALAESFFGTLKNERVHRTVYPTRKRAKADIARYIEIFYNRQRLHSALDYRTPHEVRSEYVNRQAAA